MEEESGRGSGRVGSDFLSAIAGRVGSTIRRVGSSRVKKSDPWTTLCLLTVRISAELYTSSVAYLGGIWSWPPSGKKIVSTIGKTWFGSSVRH